MNLEELKKLREELATAKKYVPGHIDSVRSDYITFDYAEQLLFTKVDALSSIKTEEAVKFFESLLEDYTKYFTVRGIPFDKMSIDLFTDFYLEQEIVDTADDYAKIKRELATPNKFLKDIVRVSPSVEIRSEGKDVSYKVPSELENLQYSNAFVVNYDEFASRLRELGYELNYQTFEELIDGAFMQKPANFEVDFTLEDRKTR